MVNGEQTALEAGLRYVSDLEPGIVRRGVPGRFRYEYQGARMKDETTLARIQSIVIPPAWKDVWISPRTNGHLQAAGRDAKGRKQYRYHNDFRSSREGAKYEKLSEFGKRLPALRRRIAKDIAGSTLSRDRMLALVVLLLDRTLMRVGNEAYAVENGSYGLTTLRNRHARVKGSQVQLSFRGKSGKDHRVSIRDKRVAGIIRKCQDLPGQELFQYVDPDAGIVSLGSADVNAYLRQVMGDDFTAKDFRTWAGSALACEALAKIEAGDSAGLRQQQLAGVVREVAEALGNTPAVCRKCYVHPAVIAMWESGDLHRTAAAASTTRGLRQAESQLLRLLDPRPGRRPVKLAA